MSPVTGTPLTAPEDASIDVGSRKFELEGQTDGCGLATGMVDTLSIMHVRTLDGDGVPYEASGMSVAVWDGSSGTAVEGVAAPTYNALLERWEIRYTPTAAGTTMFRWSCADGGVGFQALLALNGVALNMIYHLRIQLDKSLKARDKTWGFTDTDLFMYLVEALAYFNQHPPATAVTLAQAGAYGLDSIVLDLAVLYGIRAQMMYAVDTDVTYNDQGIGLTIDHFGKLQGIYSIIMNGMEDRIKKAKWQFSRARAVVAYNPERAKSALMSQVMTSGYPYMSFIGMHPYQIMGL